ncbi:venom serine protease-like [Uranotaenia lowii]|uniref:venom serine protease-like n=1 Tax=Uranotaenia lowii TaxID=190385 RepID=UPI002479B19C|nr:venom serine protease-like [Uranotaenia lowii]
MIAAYAFVFGFLTNLPAIFSLFEGCDNEYQLAANASVQLQSPYYPGRYPSGSSCRYTFTAPVGYAMDVSCTININTAQNGACSTELLYMSSEGLSSLTGAEYFCGSGTLKRKSYFNKLMMAYTSSSSTNSGSFLCQILVSPAPCDCGWSVWQKIVGGSVAQPNEYTSLVGLIDLQAETVFCSAVIINTRYVLTAAHCVYDIPNFSRISLVVGTQDYKAISDTRYSTRYSIEKSTTHEQYVPQTRENDIAIIRTTRNIDYNRGVGPVCLPFNYWYYDFSTLQVDVAGWGTTSFGGQVSTTLLKTTLDVIANRACNVQYLTDKKVCTYTTGKDTCQFDSGGPLFLRGAQRMYTIGVVSYGGACAASTPSVNIRVTAYLDWIQQKTPDASYCVK